MKEKIKMFRVLGMVTILVLSIFSGIPFGDGVSPVQNVGAAGTVIDDFEDGDVSDWNVWNSGSSPLTTTSQYSAEGTYSMEVSSTTGVEKTFTATDYTSFSFYQRLESIPPSRQSVELYDSGSISTSVTYTTDGSIVWDDPTETGYDPIDTGVDITTGKWYKLSFVNIDWSAGTADLVVENANGDVLGRADGTTIYGTALSKIRFYSYVKTQMDFIAADGATIAPAHTISGTVTGSDGSAIEGASVTVTDTSDGSTVGSKLTNATGGYSIGVGDGTYNVTVDKDGYQKETEQVEISGSSVIQNFTLFKEKIRLIVNNWQSHSSNQKYVVRLLAGNNITDITDSTTVTSNNTSVITVNNTEHLLIATENKEIAERVEVSATYGNYSTTENVTVANRSLNNIHLMPPSQFVSSFMGVGGTKHGIASEIQWILFIIFIMSVAAKTIDNPWAGIGSGMLVSILIWVLEYISLGVVLSTTFFGILAALIIVKTRKQSADITVNNGGVK